MQVNHEAPQLIQVAPTLMYVKEAGAGRSVSMDSITGKLTILDPSCSAILEKIVAAQGGYLVNNASEEEQRIVVFLLEKGICVSLGDCLQKCSWFLVLSYAFLNIFYRILYLIYGPRALMTTLVKDSGLPESNGLAGLRFANLVLASARKAHGLPFVSAQSAVSGQAVRTLLRASGYPSRLRAGIRAGDSSLYVWVESGGAIFDAGKGNLELKPFEFVEELNLGSSRKSVGNFC